MKIEEIDKNLLVNTNLTRKDVKVYDICEKPFKVYGLIKPKNDRDKFRRMPEDVAKATSDNVFALSTHTSGGRVRFRTNSSYIAIKAEMPRIDIMPHFAATGSAGFDLFATIDGKEVCMNTFVPAMNMKDGYASEFVLRTPATYDYTINFPLYSEVSKLYVILEENAFVEEAAEYEHTTPVVFYGSSITQGGCVSRPATAYPSIIARRLNTDFINLGFSGSAKGEREMAEYIADLDMSVFVYDYDYNSVVVEELEATHWDFFEIIRKKNPDLPIICISRPGNMLDGIQRFETERRCQIITDTVNRSKANGDNNVYYIDGRTFQEEYDSFENFFVDNCHPNDLGHMCMATVIGKLVKDLI